MRVDWYLQLPFWNQPAVGVLAALIVDHVTLHIAMDTHCGSWPAGVAPETLPQLLDFPLQVVADLVDAESKQLIPHGCVENLLQHMARGFLGASAYTGLGAWELAAHYLQAAMAMMSMQLPELSRA